MGARSTCQCQCRCLYCKLLQSILHVYIQHRSRVTSQIHASYTRVLPVPHVTHLIITTPIEMAPLVKIPHKILTGCYKVWWGMFQNLAKSCNLRNPIKILIRSCQDVTRCNKVFQIPVRSCMILLRSRQDSCQDLAGNFY